MSIILSAEWAVTEFAQFIIPYPLHPMVLREPTKDAEEIAKERLGLSYKTIVFVGLFCGSLTTEYIVTSGFILSLIWILKQNNLRFRTILIIELMIVALLRVAFYLGIIPVSMHEIIVGVCFILLISLNYYTVLSKSHMEFNEL